MRHVTECTVIAGAARGRVLGQAGLSKVIREVDKGPLKVPDDELRSQLEAAKW
jgi:hypothetical protein